MTEKERRNDMRRFDWVVEHMRKLIELNAPSSIKANCIIRLFLPRLMKLTGSTNECFKELAQYISRGMCIYTGICYMCQKNDAIGNDELCLTCQAQVDQFEASLGEMKELNDDDLTEE